MDYSLEEKRRYRKEGWAQLPEMRSELIEMECDPHEGESSSDDDDNHDAAGASEARRDPEAVPVYLAMVDLCCSEDTLELLRSALQAALEALPAAARFGIVTFSHKVGLYDISGEAGTESSVRCVHLEVNDTGPPSAVQLEEALPLESLLAPVGACREAITNVIESLVPESAFPPSSGDEATELPGSRAFGSGLQAVLRYLSGAIALQQHRLSTTTASEGNAQDRSTSVAAEYAGARLLIFLCGPPNLGRGAVLSDNPSDQRGDGDRPPLEPAMGNLDPFSHPASTTTQLEVDPGALEFYEEAAAAAASLAVCIDLFVVSGEGCGLTALEPLVAATGGTLFLYPAADQAALPQDIYKRLGSPLARGGLLRLRTSRGLQVTSSYGHTFPDDQFDNLFHLISADANDAFTFEMDYTSSAGVLMDGSDGSQPSMQMAFQYSIIVPDPDSMDPMTRNPTRWVLKRRMRVLTHNLPLATSVRQVVDGCDADVVLTVLVHKLVEAAEAEGAVEAHSLLYDWLAILTLQYNRCILGLSSEASAQQVDAAFEAVESLQGLPRAVYGLLRSPLLVQRTGQHPDTSAATRILWASLQPADIRRSVYPLLSSFSSPDSQAFPSHSLSEAALSSSGAPIFLLDSYSEVMVYYTAAAIAEGTVVFPPPQASLLRSAIAAARSGRRMTPTLTMLRGGIDDDRVFLDSLIEEPDVGLQQAGLKVGNGVVQFLESVQLDVHQLLKE